MGQLSSRLVISLVDRVSGPARGITGSLRSLTAQARAQPLLVAGNQARQAGAHFVRFGASAMTAAYGLRALLEPTREFNTSIWGTTAALAGQTKDMKLAQRQADDMRVTALKLSKAYGVMPEVFAKAGEEAAKMGLSQAKSAAVMEAAGKTAMSDQNVNASAMAKSLGTYGIIYGAEEDEAKYRQQVLSRASSLALAGASTRSSASGVEEGLKNYMGVHGAFGGTFEDAVALTAVGTQGGLMEKEVGTALKTLTTRFLRMPAEGRAALSGSGIDINKFMDFSAVDPTRARNQLLAAFPQQLGKNAKSKVQGFLEKAQRDGRLKDPAIINETLQFLEKQGLDFAGSEDRDAATSKIAAIMHGAGGRFDPLGFFSEIQSAIDDGRAGPGIMAAIGEPKRLSQYLSLLKTLEEAKNLRDELVRDKGRYLESIAKGYTQSEAGKLVAMEASWTRLSLSLVRSNGIQTALGTLEWMANVFEGMPDWASSAAGGLLAFAAVATPVGYALRGLGATLKAFYAYGIGAAKAMGLLGLGGSGAAAGGGLFSLGKGMVGGAAAAAASKRMLSGMAAASQASQRMLAGMGASGAAGALASQTGLLTKIGTAASFAARGLKLLSAAGLAWMAVEIVSSNWEQISGFLKSVGVDADAAVAKLRSLWNSLSTVGWNTAREGGKGFNPRGGMGSYGATTPGPAATIAGSGPAVASGTAGSAQGSLEGVKSEAAGVASSVSSAMGQVEGIVGGVNLYGEGQRIGQSLADGIRSAIPAIQSAGQAAAAAAAQSAMRGAYSDGGQQ